MGKQMAMKAMKAPATFFFSFQVDCASLNVVYIKYKEMPIKKIFNKISPFLDL
jgi:hypothetical protein